MFDVRIVRRAKLTPGSLMGQLSQSSSPILALSPSPNRPRHLEQSGISDRPASRASEGQPQENTDFVSSGPTRRHPSCRVVRASLQSTSDPTPPLNMAVYIRTRCDGGCWAVSRHGERAASRLSLRHLVWRPRLRAIDASTRLVSSRLGLATRRTLRPALATL